MPSPFASSVSDVTVTRKGFLFALGFLIYVAARFLLWHLSSGYLIDDAYITLRYVQNLADAGSLSFHIGDHIYGISTIAYPLLLAVVKLVLPNVDLVAIDVGVNIALEYLCLVVLISLFIRLHTSTFAALLLSLAVLWNPIFLSSSQGGMETPLFLLWLLLAMVVIDESLLLAALCAGMALMTRPEGSIAIAIVAAITFFRRGPFSIYLILGAAVGIFAAFYFIGFGTLYPASVEIKHLIGGKEPLYAFFYFLKAPALLIPLGSIPWPISALIVYTIAAYGIAIWPSRNGAMIFGLGTIVFNLCLYGIANPPVWFWYPASYVTFVAIFFFYGLYILLRQSRWLALPLLLIWVALDVRWTYFTKGDLLDVYTHRVREYREVIQELKHQHELTSSQSIFTHEIGAVGYYSMAHVIDAVGLINPSLAHLGIVPDVHQGVHYGLATQAFLEETKPDFIVLQSNLIAQDAKDTVDQQYRFLFEVPDSAIDPFSGNIQVFKRIYH